MPRVMALQLDGASPELIEKWTDDGSLPNLPPPARAGWLRAPGIRGSRMAEATHAVFNTGQNPAATGISGYSVWDPTTMRSRTPAADWLPFTPFWRTFTDSGPRAVVIDPGTVDAPQPFHGVEIIGWATHDALAPFQTWPPDLAAGVSRRFGAPLLPDEYYGLITKREFRETAHLAHEINRKFRDLCLDWMQTQEWDLFLAVNYTLHHGGHRLWNTVNITDPLSDNEKTELEGALRQVYIECDAAVGELVRAAGPDTRLLVFSLHGMHVNHSRTYVFPQMLRQITHGRPSPLGLTKRIRELIPRHWRHEFKSRLPFELRRRLTSYWRMSDHNWEETRVFGLLSDTEGYVRINLKGREARGIVEPGQEYESLCGQIAEGLKSFVDADTGEPVVREIFRPQESFQGERFATLPDLVVVWMDTPAASHRALVSPRYGTVAWPTPGRNPEGRSGNHGPQGMLMTGGPGVRSGEIAGANILDLAPTLLSLLEQLVPPQMEGRALNLFG